MLDIVLFFFVYMPVMNMLRNRQNIDLQKRSLITVAVSTVMIAYLAQKTLTADRPQNLYEFLGLESTSFTKAELQKAYRASSRKYHPDKNLEEDTTEKFILLKDATEIMEKPFKRSAYDLFGQMRFDNEQKLYDDLSMQYNVEDPVEKEKLEDFFNHQMRAMRTLRSILEVVPTYVAWGITCLLMVERSYGRPAITLLAIAMCVFEIMTRIYYGLDRYDVIFDLIRGPFPRLYTLGECMDLIRSAFPIFLVCLITVLDLTFDKQVFGEDAIQALREAVDKQKSLITHLDGLVKHFKQKNLFTDDEDDASNKKVNMFQSLMEVYTPGLVQAEKVKIEPDPTENDDDKQLVESQLMTTNPDDPSLKKSYSAVQKKDKAILAEFKKVQETVGDFNATTLMSLVAEQMNFFEKEEESQSMISKIVKGGFSILFALSAITYALDLDKVTKSGNVKPRRR